MSDIQIEIKNLPQIKAAFAKSPILMIRNLNIAIQGATIGVERESRYQTSGRLVNVRSNRLRSSHYSRFSNLKGEVGTNVEYDHWVHDGTKFMQARPYLQIAVLLQQPTTDKWFEKAVQKTLDQIASET